MSFAFKLDPFDPRGWPIEYPDDPVRISLSGRIDCECIVDRQDYEWAKAFLWCHTYGSGSMDPETWTIERPDHIYARRSVPIGGFTANGRPRYGNEWLHRLICLRAYGPPPPLHVTCDHLNGDTLDNRRANLRWATRAMNAQNVRGSEMREVFIREQVQARALGIA